MANFRRTTTQGDLWHRRTVGTGGRSFEGRPTKDYATETARGNAEGRRWAHLLGPPVATGGDHYPRSELGGWRARQPSPQQFAAHNPSWSCPPGEAVFATDPRLTNWGSSPPMSENPDRGTQSFSTGQTRSTRQKPYNGISG